MLTIPGPKTRYCDGIDRRGFLRIGGLGLGGWGGELGGLRGIRWKRKGEGAR